MKLKIFSVAVCLIVSARGERESLVSEDVYLRIKECIYAYYHTPAKWSESQTKALREKAFAGLDDREKIRALAEWMFRIPPPTHSEIPSNAGSLLIAPEPVIKDYSEIHRLMSVETDSRRFYQLAVFASAFGKKNGDEFMADCARGLFMKGKAADLGQSTIGHPLNEISSFCFSMITQQLRDDDQSFRDEVYPELVKLDFEQRPLALAKWLKKNRPGCENLEIPSESFSPQVKPPAATPAETRSSTEYGVRPTRPKKQKLPTGVLASIVGASLLAVAAALWLFFRRK